MSDAVYSGPITGAIQEICSIDDGDLIAIFVRGQQPLEAMSELAVFYMRRNYGAEVEPKCAHERIRVVPHREYGGRYVRGQGPGSFCVTMASFKEWAL